MSQRPAPLLHLGKGVLLLCGLGPQLGLGLAKRDADGLDESCCFEISGEMAVLSAEGKAGHGVWG